MNQQCMRVIKALLFGLAMLGAGVGFQMLATETQLLMPG